jgi:hypothetical protein
MESHENNFELSAHAPAPHKRRRRVRLVIAFGAACIALLFASLMW